MSSPPSTQRPSHSPRHPLRGPAPNASHLPLWDEQVAPLPGMCGWSPATSNWRWFLPLKPALCPLSPPILFKRMFFLG